MFPPTSVGSPPASQNLARQCRRRSFPVRPSDSHNRPRQKLRRQFNLANHRLAHGAGLHQHWRIDGNPRTDHNQILPTKRPLAMPARLDGNSVIEQRRNLIAQFVSALGIGNSNPRPMRLQKKRRSHPGLAESHDQHAFVFQFHQVHLTTESQRHRENQHHVFSLRVQAGSSFGGCHVTLW